MKLHVSNLKPTVVAWIDEVLIPKSSGTQTFLITLYMLQNQSKVDEMLEPMKVFADADGNFDLDYTKANANVALEKAGGVMTLPYINYNFDKDDLDKVFEIAKRYSN